MKPPICYLCMTDLALDDYFGNNNGGLVAFKNYKPLPSDCVGHPQGLEWFCGKHIAAAKQLSYLNAETALELLQAKYNISNNPSMRLASEALLWVTSVGTNKTIVFRLIRKMMSLSPKEVITLLRQEKFFLTKGWSEESKDWKNKLEQAGVSVELRFD